MSGKFGYLYPVLLLEAMPGDTIRDQTTLMARFAPMFAPIMHRVDAKIDSFFVPIRLLTEQKTWEDYITGGPDGQTTSPILPFLMPDSFSNKDYMSKGTLWDYLGLPVHEGAAPANWSQQEFLALPFRAYTKIWNDWFRDPTLDAEIDLGLAYNGDVTALSEMSVSNILEVRRRGWERDLFTSALPWAQRGAEVLLPLSLTGDTMVSSITGNPVGTGKNIVTDPLIAGAFGTSDAAFPIANYERGEFEMSNATSTINDFRTSLAIQSWLETNARSGYRYVDQILSHYGTRVPDYRLQRAEYLGGGRQPVQISEVLSTADTASVPVGDMAGHGISVGKSNRFTYRCQEHGYVISILSIVPRTAYMQGIPKMWLRQDKFDWAFPEFAHMGEQVISSKEVFYSFDAADDSANDADFGYVPRYAEYKFMQDRVAGDFRDDLLFWHLSRKFTARPSLDSDFVTMREHDTAQEETYRRIFAVQDGTDYLWIQLFHNITAKRPLPYFGVPRLIG